jgi:hypothetical protein
MWDRIARNWWLILMITGLAAGGMLLLQPGYVRQIIAAVFVFNALGLTTINAVSYLREARQGVLTRQQVILRTLRDLLGLVVILATAAFAGSTAGVFAALWAGPWVGLTIGLAAGFAAGWMMGRIWRNILGSR